MNLFFQFVKYSPDDPRTKHGGYDNKALDLHDLDEKKENPVSTVYNGSHAYVNGTDYEKSFTKL